MRDKPGHSKNKNKDILVLGIGNYLMGDEGLGVHFINEFQKKDIPSNVEIVDGGTGGFHLLSHLHSHPINIFIDAATDGLPKGEVRLIKPKFASDFPVFLSSHDIGLKDLIESLYLLGDPPIIYIFTVSIQDIRPMYIGLSEEVRSSIPVLIDQVSELIIKINNGVKV